MLYVVKIFNLTTSTACPPLREKVGLMVVVTHAYHASFPIEHFIYEIGNQSSPGEPQVP